MSRVLAYALRVAVEVPDGEPDPEVGDLMVSVVMRRRGEVLLVEGTVLPTEEECAQALDAAVALLPEGDLTAAEAELERLRRGSKATLVRGLWVERHHTRRSDDTFEFVVYEDGMAGPMVRRATAAERLLRAEQARKMGVRRT